MKQISMFGDHREYAVPEPEELQPIVKLKPVEEWPIETLRHHCRRGNVLGYSTMGKAKLVENVKMVLARKQKGVAR